jgi:hypothetical protein
MTIPITRKVLIIIIAAIWIVHFTMVSLPFHRVIPQYETNEWCEFLYNIISVMAVFYATAHFMKQWLNRFSLATFIRLQLHKKIYYLIDWHIFKIFVVAAIYVAISLLLDNEIFGQYDYKDFSFQFERRLSRVHSYVLAGPLYALVLFLFRKLLNRIRLIEAENKALKVENKTLSEDVFEIKNLYRELKKETSQN